MSRYPLISIIVPVFKAERYLSRCVDSLLRQTYSNIEILLVDDGSPDHSGVLCDKIALKDKRIRVFHKENGGVSSARNLGLKHAKGEWISFVDADDSVSEDFFQCNYFDTIDIFQKSYKIIYEDKGECVSVDVVDKSLFTEEMIYTHFVRKRTNALWDKIIRRDVIADNKFNENVLVGEDFLFSLSLIREVKHYQLCSRGHYNYYIHKGSAMDVINNDTLGKVKIMFDNINHINNILCSENSNRLRSSIIYQSYINVLCGYRSILSKTELSMLKFYLHNMKLEDLYYVPNKVRIKLFVKRFMSFLWR